MRFLVGGIGMRGPEDRGLAERCLRGFNAGPPIVPVSPRGRYNQNMQLFQTPDHVVVFTEMVHDARIVPLDGRDPLPDGLRQWMGSSRGRWEGDTLVSCVRSCFAVAGACDTAARAPFACRYRPIRHRVTLGLLRTDLRFGTVVVETTSFTDKTASFVPFTRLAIGTGRTLHLTERFRLVGPDTLLYEFTIDDPASFTRPFTAAVPMKRGTSPLFEYACHEGNYGMRNMLSGARIEEGQMSEGGHPARRGSPVGTPAVRPNPAPHELHRNDAARDERPLADRRRVHAGPGRRHHERGASGRRPRRARPVHGRDIVEDGLAGMRAEIAEVRTEIAEVRTEIARLDTRLSTQIANLRSEQRTDVAGVRTEIANLETRLIRWMVGTVLATGALTFGILRFPG